MNYGFNNFNNFDSFAQRHMDATAQKRELRFIGSLLGSAIILYVIITNIFAVGLMAFPNFRSVYTNDAVVQFSVDILVTVFSMLVPFSLAGFLISRRTNEIDIIPFNAPVGALNTFLAIIGALGLCMAGDLATSAIVSLSQLIGHEFTAPELTYPDGLSGFLLSTVRVALCAAICEELSFRGTAMQPLRKYGDWFAVISSSLLFALMHGNLVQAPFALIAGFGLGWVCIKTHSVWTSIIVHFLNNLISVGVMYLTQSTQFTDSQVDFIYSIVLYTLLLGGALCIYFFTKRTKLRQKVVPEKHALSTPQKFFALFVNVPMVLAVLYMLWATAQYVN